MKRFFPYDVFGRLTSLHIKMAEKERKIQPTALPLDTLPERCTMTMYREILVCGSLMPAGDSSKLLSDTLPRQDGEGEKSRPLGHLRQIPFSYQKPRDLSTIMQKATLRACCQQLTSL